MKHTTKQSIKALLSYGQPWIYCRSEEVGKAFLSDAEQEGFLFSDGMKPTKKEWHSVLVVHKDRTISYQSITNWTMGFHVRYVLTENGKEEIVRVDYECYQKGEKDWVCRTPEFEGELHCQNGETIVRAQTSKELIDRYYATVRPQTAKSRRGTIDREELYAYEKKIGKQLVEMNASELLDMMATFYECRTDSRNIGVTMAQKTNERSNFRTFFDYYIKNYKKIKNPLDDELMKPDQICAYFEEKYPRKPYSLQELENDMCKLHNLYRKERADYCELTMWLFYCGMDKVDDILSFQEKDIDFDQKVIHLKRKDVFLNDRCIELLKKHNEVKVMYGSNRTNVLKSYRGSYYKICVREETKVDDMPLRGATARVTLALGNVIRQQKGMDWNYQLLYWLGVYDGIESLLGKEKTKRLVDSFKDEESTNVIEDLMSKFNIQPQPTTLVRWWLKNYC